MATKKQAQPTHSSLFQVSEFEQIDAPGSWMTPAGDLLRVPEEVLKPGHSPVFDIVTNTPGPYTRLSDDPYTPIGKLRSIASDADQSPNF